MLEKKSSKIILTNKERFILMLQKVPEASFLPWGLDFAGGKPEEGESFLAAGIRETREETGIIISPDACIEVLALDDEVGNTLYRRVIHLAEMDEFPPQAELTLPEHIGSVALSFPDALASVRYPFQRQALVEAQMLLA
jgi:8-oxo-dGTP pyrophosphatase MutT (NUDIX family)